MRAPDETSLLCVLSAGSGWGSFDDDAPLVASCCAIEAELREAEWRSLERVLAAIEGKVPYERLQLPSTQPERRRLALDMVAVGWGVGATASAW